MAGTMLSVRIRGLQSKEAFKDILNAWCSSKNSEPISIGSHGIAEASNGFEATVTFRTEGDRDSAVAALNAIHPGLQTDTHFLGMTVLVTPEPWRYNVIDIVAVHGLRGHAINTWTSSAPGAVMWIRDFIPAEFPNARVALVTAYSRRDSAIYQQINCVAFFGTPHRGASAAHWAMLLARLVSVRYPDAKKNLKRLRINDTVLKDLDDDFRSVVLEDRKIKFISVYELHKIKKPIWPFSSWNIKKPSILVVPEQSAILGLESSTETLIPINSCHRELCRFQSPHSNGFGQLIQSIRNTLGGFGRAQLPSKYPRDSSLGVQLLGREEIISRIYDHIAECHDGTASLPGVALVGAPGVGKSSLAKHICDATLKKMDFQHVLFISAESESKLVHDLKNILRLSNVDDSKIPGSAEQIRHRFQDMLSKTDGHWLLVYDNAVEEPFLSRYWPSSKGGSVVITSNCKSIARVFTGNTIQTLTVEGLTEDEGAELLSRSARFPSEYQEIDSSTWNHYKVLSGRFCGWPLALRQLSASIHHARISPQRMIQVLDNEDNGQSNTYRFQSIGEPNEHTLEDAWAALFPRLQPNPVKLLNILSLLDRDSIPARMFENSPERERAPEDPFDFLFSELEWVPSMILGATKFVDCHFSYIHARGSLLDYGLVSMDECDNISLHRVVQTTRLKRMSDFEREGAFSMALWLLRKRFPRQELGAHMHNVWDTCETFLLQVLAFENSVRAWMPLFIGDEASDYINLICDCAWYLWEIGQHNKGLSILDAAEKGYVQVIGAESLNAARIYVIRGSIYSTLNQYDKSGPLFLEALRLHQKLLTPDHPLIANSLMQVGNYYTSQDEFDRAINSHREALRIRQSCQGTPPHMMALSYFNLCRPLIMTNRSENLLEAEGLLKLAKAAEERLNHRLLVYYKLHRLYILGNIWASRGNFQKALKVHCKALELRKMGGVAPSSTSSFLIATSLHKVGTLYHRLGQQEQAVAALQKAIQVLDPPQPRGVDRALPRTKTQLSRLARTEMQLASITTDKEAVAWRVNARGHYCEAFEIGNPARVNWARVDFEKLVPPIDR
ncbi:hypothetical protein QBC40DRAFT_315968 [Triangularia verruculosa]|uniref:NB-ARC domain-containing protein n=1 Tax=Triangularia verruculosa TaxID=2587418 RepID=A0AAN6X7F8_9PEZI|nr:hypothetical protein QBC40DRAFT_315968 [Triangularia verruculosa]